MKIKTITCHEVYNYGASLQEYALLKYLQNNGHDAETIHYKPYYLSKQDNIFRISNTNWSKNIFLKLIYLTLKLPKRIIGLKRKRSFDSFSKRYIKTTSKLYRTNEDLKNNIPSADAYICGSDQIWNSFFENGKDPAFYLNFVPNNKLKISYAASFAIDEIEGSLKDFVKSGVERLDHISVRETSGKRILNDLGITEVTQVLDPVFLIDKKHWKKMGNKSYPKQDYVFIYDFDSNPLIKKMAFKLKNEKNHKIVSVNANIDYADFNYYLDGPEKFLSLVDHAKFVISNSFHAVAFSLIFQKQFVVFNRTDKINTRMRDLLGSVNQPELLINNDQQINDFNHVIDYKDVEPRLNQLINSSKSFLNNALNN